MQIGCKRFDCMKAVEACYWSCKFRKDCKDWHDALSQTPGMEAVSAQLEAASKKSGRPFDAQTLVLLNVKKKRGVAAV